MVIKLKQNYTIISKFIILKYIYIYFQKSQFKQSATRHGEPRTQLPDLPGCYPEQSQPRRAARPAAAAARAAHPPRATRSCAAASTRARQAATRLGHAT